MWLDFDKLEEKFTGMDMFFKNLNIVVGQALVFVYDGGFDFRVWILGLDGAEIDYPLIVHSSQKCDPKTGFFNIILVCFYNQMS